MAEITVNYCGKSRIINSDEAVSILEVLHKHGFYIESPCNGNGTCGKCRVLVENGNLSYTKEETEILSETEIREGIHLSCMIKITEDIEITLLDKGEGASILTDIGETGISGNSVIKKHAIILPKPSICDQRPDDMRIFEQVNMVTKISGKEDSFMLQSSKKLQPNGLPLYVLQKLPEVICQGSYQVTIIEILNEITGVEAGDTTHKMYGVAIDIGTTTIAAYLYDLIENKLIAVEPMINPQQKYGADVISRIDYSSKSHDKGVEITYLIRDALTNLVKKLANSTGKDLSDIYLITLAGNTTMVHFLLGLPSRNIAVAPFIPVTLSEYMLYPEVIGMEINEAGRVLVLPSVSAYIGADTVAAVLSARIYLSKDIALLLDIGTNGEIVLGNKDEMYACSTAAGPAFEGANILCGTGSVDGAISEVFISDGKELKIKTIGGYRPIGICGSGLVDAVACMLRIGIIDETGRILDKDELSKDASPYGDGLVEINGQHAFALASTDMTIHGGQIVITQKDIREIQNAKAAIAAGMYTLIKESGHNLKDVQRVYLAGGFGNYMRIESAIMIGLLPKGLTGRVYTVGNAAGAGAVFSLLSEKEYSNACLISKKIRYIELSSNAYFVGEYTENMLFDMA